MRNYYFILLSVLLCACTTGQQEPEAAKGTTTHVSKSGKQMNISILWDLSDRIKSGDDQVQPDQAAKDIAIIEYFADYLKKDMTKKGAYSSRARLKVFFSPQPASPDINALAAQLAIDLAAKDVKEKKIIYDSISSMFGQTSRQIIALSAGKSEWPGADIYRFFKNDVADYCIARDTSFRNVLVILTDGYLYHSNSKGRNGNRTEYILPVLLQELGLRGNQDYRSVFDTKDCGLIAPRQDLGQLEILVLEVNAAKNYKNDEDLIKLYLQKWFREMGVQRFEIYNTDLPGNTLKRVADFIG